MRIPGAGRLAVLGLGVAVSVAGAQSTGKYTAKPTEQTSSWWKSWFGSKPEEAKVLDHPPVALQAEADKQAELDRLMRAYWRRQEVCDRLRDIALQANDDKLYEEAGRLEDLAWRLHQSKSGKLFGTPVAAADEPPEPPEESTLDVLKRAAPGGNLPPRLRQGGKMEPATANRAERKREEE
ncbi:MAG: hypothetical protein U0797_20250 [Gemmataceae bacterium]